MGMIIVLLSQGYYGIQWADTYKGIILNSSWLMENAIEVKAIIIIIS